MKRGDKVKVTVYGVTRKGAIDRIGESGTIVFVRMADSNKIEWFHSSSLTILEK